MLIELNDKITFCYGAHKKGKNHTTRAEATLSLRISAFAFETKRNMRKMVEYDSLNLVIKEEAVVNFNQLKLNKKKSQR